MRVKVYDWFLNKSVIKENVLCYRLEGDMEYEVNHETDKAYLLSVVVEGLKIEFWCPKSCTYTDDVEVSDVSKGLKYNESLINIAKANNIKGIRVGLKTSTLIKKLTEANIPIPARN